MERLQVSLTNQVGSNKHVKGQQATDSLDEKEDVDQFKPNGTSEIDVVLAIIVMISHLFG